MSEEKPVECPGHRRPQFGTRFLKDQKNVFEHNAWDNVVWDESQEAAAEAKVRANSQIILTAKEIDTLEEEAASQWENFYGVHQNRFFKDRNWLFTEFPELAPHLAHTFPLKQNPGDAQLDQSGEESETKEQRTSGIETEMLSINENVSELQALRISRAFQHLEEGVNDMQETKDNPQRTSTRPRESYPGESSTFRVLEVGCGVGNTVFPILSVNNDEGLFVYCCDFSKAAVSLVKASPDYNENRCFAFVCDITSEDWGAPFPKSSLDVIVCIFVLSALHPDKVQDAVNKMTEYLRPGGRILFRDYGRYDLAQLRFKKGRCLGENFYARGDGTRCYFFTREEVQKLMTNAGLVEEQNLVDRRLQVNRGKLLKMYRVWIQAKYLKPLHEDGS